MERKKKRERRRPLTARQLLVAAGAAVLLLALIFTLPAVIRRIQARRGEGGDPISLDPLDDKGKLVVTELDIKNAILGEAREDSMLVVYEQDIKQEFTLTRSFLNWEVFTKTKTARMFGTGYYAVDLSKLEAENIKVNLGGGVVEITIPRAQLLTVSPDYDKTEFEDTEYGWLAFGEIKLTLEQQNQVNKEVFDRMKEELLSDKCMKRADTAALEFCRDLFKKVVSAVPGVYTVSVKFAEDLP